jgi:tetrathionate reductase subunit B
VKEAGGNPDSTAADKCSLCVHRLENGVVPACVNTCPHEARLIGNYNDATSNVRQAIDAAAGQVSVLLEGEGTDPRVFYIGLDEQAYLEGDEARKEAGLQTQI